MSESAYVPISFPQVIYNVIALDVYDHFIDSLHLSVIMQMVSRCEQFGRTQSPAYLLEELRRKRRPIIGQDQF